MFFNLYFFLAVSGVTAQGDFEEKSNTLSQVNIPVTSVVNLLPLIGQRFIDGGLTRVLHTMRFELILITYGEHGK